MKNFAVVESFLLHVNSIVREYKRNEIHVYGVILGSKFKVGLEIEIFWGDYFDIIWNGYFKCA